MSLSNTVRIELIDPYVDNARRTIFNISQYPFTNKVAILGLGVYDNQQTGNTGLFYTSINGVLDPVSSISLVQSGETIASMSQTDFLQAWCAMKIMTSSNQKSEDLDRFELLNGMNLSISSGAFENWPGAANLPNAGSWTLNPRFKDYNNTWDNGRTYLHNQIKIPATSTGQCGMVFLNDFMPFFSDVAVIPAMNKLQLVIEWALDANRFYQDTNAPANVVNPAYTHNLVQLAVQQILGNDPNEGKKITLNYREIFTESFPVPAVADGVTQTIDFRSKAFLGRQLNRIAYFNQVNTDDGWCNRYERSPAMFGERMQIYVNGTPFLPREGITTPAQKLASYSYAWGKLNMPFAACLPTLIDAGNSVLSETDSENGAQASNRLVHNFSVGGEMIGALISRLSFQYTRVGNGAFGTAVQQADQTGAFSLLVFGECQRQMVIDEEGNVVKNSY